MTQKKIDLDNYQKRMGIKNKKSIIPKAKKKKIARGTKEKKSTSSSQINDTPQRPKKVFIDSEELPATYNKSTLTLIARDPYWIHAYWELAPTSIDEIRERIGNKIEQSTYVLRMYDVTLKDFNGDNANNWFDIDLTPNDNNWYVAVQQLTKRFEVQLRTIEELKATISDLQENMHTLKNAQKATQQVVQSQPIEAPKPVLQQAPVQAEASRAEPKASTSPRCGNYTPEDVSVEKFFYSGPGGNTNA